MKPQYEGENKMKVFNADAEKKPQHGGEKKRMFKLICTLVRLYMVSHENIETDENKNNAV